MCVSIGSSFPKIAVTDDIVANHGDNISVTCNVTYRGYAAILQEITWMKDGKRLERVRYPIPGEPGRTLTPIVIDSVRTEDGGLYTCVLDVLLKYQKQTLLNITGDVNISGAFFILTYIYLTSYFDFYVSFVFVCMFVVDVLVCALLFLKPHKHYIFASQTRAMKEFT